MENVFKMFNKNIIFVYYISPGNEILLLVSGLGPWYQTNLLDLDVKKNQMSWPKIRVVIGRLEYNPILKVNQGIIKYVAGKISSTKQISLSL